jgi:predicted DCC family thiol-disulfide oxidoreductase YuxK
MGRAGHLVYDADCGFCTRSAQWLDPEAVPWSALDLEAVGVTQELADANAGWLVDGRVAVLGANAIAAAMRAKRGSAGLVGWFLRAPGIRRLAHLVYPRIAANRHRMPGGTAACRIAVPGEKHLDPVQRDLS